MEFSSPGRYANDPTGKFQFRLRQDSSAPRYSLIPIAQPQVDFGHLMHVTVREVRSRRLADVVSGSILITCHLVVESQIEMRIHFCQLRVGRFGRFDDERR
jgi:hypothetical protein